MTDARRQAELAVSHGRFPAPEMEQFIVRMLSIQNPYATLILQGEKTIEVRSWSTAYRGDVLICSTKVPSKHSLAGIVLAPNGVMLCIAELSDIRPFVWSDEPKAKLPWVKKHFSWVLTNIRPVVQVPVTGKQGLLPAKNDVLSRVCISPVQVPPRLDNLQARDSSPLGAGVRVGATIVRRRIVFTETLEILAA